MKNKIFNLKNVFALFSLLLMGGAANAADGAGFAGVSDINMLYILLSIGVLMLILVLVLANIIKSITANKEIWQYMQAKKNAAKTAGVIALLLGFSFSVSAQEAGATPQAAWVMSSTLFWALISLDAFLVMVVFYLFNILKQVVSILKPEEEKVEASAHTVVDSWTAILTDSVPIEQEEEIMTDHSYDGIHELDNNLPPWWVWGFYGTIIFAFVYLMYFQFMGGPNSTQEYIAEVEQAEVEKAAFMATMANSIDETNVTLIADAGRLEKGKSIFVTNCAACHGESGGSMPGGVGPNLTDEYWIHGGGISDLFKTIKYGVPTKGMISWESQLSPSQIQDVSSYILSLVGTNPPNAKEPQGELYKAPNQTEEPSTTNEEIVEPASEEEVTDETASEVVMK